MICYLAKMPDDQMPDIFSIASIEYLAILANRQATITICITNYITNLSILPMFLL